MLIQEAQGITPLRNAAPNCSLGLGRGGQAGGLGSPGFLVRCPLGPAYVGQPQISPHFSRT